jgi:hypothetical protein
MPKSKRSIPPSKRTWSNCQNIHAKLWGVFAVSKLFDKAFYVIKDNYSLNLPLQTSDTIYESLYQDFDPEMLELLPFSNILNWHYLTFACFAYYHMDICILFWLVDRNCLERDIALFEYVLKRQMLPLNNLVLLTISKTLYGFKQARKFWGIPNSNLLGLTKHIFGEISQVKKVNTSFKKGLIKLSKHSCKALRSICRFKTFW